MYRNLHQFTMPVTTPIGHFIRYPIHIGFTFVGIQLETVSHLLLNLIHEWERTTIRPLLSRYNVGVGPWHGSDTDIACVVLL